MDSLQRTEGKGPVKKQKKSLQLPRKGKLLTDNTRKFERYFPTKKDPRTGKGWIRDPFINKPGESSTSVQEEDQLLKIANDGGFKSSFETTTLPMFWIKVMAEYPEIATTAL
ncbi:hypothetical protein SRHO_G00306420 [Serrasalmus rhombeus]